ncbi:MAG: acetate--CoA ligase family protein [Anaerolineae bacterium]|nr:acetate--CoA ligase family protein [Anaerolineae bacterium]MCX8068042.1 acetate--CoA ligase family protein [Anaerolineae bacterium]MDW7992827.1 acetate--CoA ligase family protein [Anaerolineae bacterium]
MEAIPLDPMTALFTPRAVALIGSVGEGRLGYHLLRQMLDGGFPPQNLAIVNPRGQGALGVPGFPSLAEAGLPLDMAVVVAPAASVPQVLEECAEVGIRVAVVITAGFSEVGNIAGEEAIREIVRRTGLRVVGPNCAGIVNTHHRLFPTLETRPPAGGVSLVAQSGALGGVFLAWAKEQGLGVAKFVSYGNAADLNEVDFLRYLAEDPQTQVVALYLETVQDGRAFLEALSACTARKPVVVIKAGRTGSGQRATLSHTGSLAGADRVYDAALRQCGAIRVTTVEEMIDLCLGFTALPPVRGRRVVIVTNSGGPGVLAADRAEEAGLEVAEPSPALREHLASFLPPQCALGNPIDLTVEGTEEGYRRVLTAVLKEYDAAIALNIAPAYLDSVPLARGVVEAARESGKPIAPAFLPGPIVADAVAYLRAHGLPNFPTGERAAAALARLAEYSLRPGRQPIIRQGASLPSVGSLPHSLLEPEAMAWLRENGLPVPEFRFVHNAEEARRAAREIGYPVVMKVVSPEILHKSEWGGVVLNIADDEEVRRAFEHLCSVAEGRDFRGAVVYPMVRGAHEVLVGLFRDPQFGPVLAFGLGGIYTEVLGDVALRVAPVDRSEAGEMIREIRGYPILAGARGRAAGDLDALADLLVRVSWLPFQYPEIAEMDLNPVFVLPVGVLVGDVRIIRSGANVGQLQAVIPQTFCRVSSAPSPS